MNNAGNRNRHETGHSIGKNSPLKYHNCRIRMAHCVAQQFSTIEINKNTALCQKSKQTRKLQQGCVKKF